LGLGIDAHRKKQGDDEQEIAHGITIRFAIKI
jgi:hypothetical protein